MNIAFHYCSIMKSNVYTGVFYPVLILFTYLLDITVTVQLASGYSSEKAEQSIIDLVKNADIPGSYTTGENRVKNPSEEFDLTQIPTYSWGENGIGTNWLHHTKVSSIFDEEQNVEKVLLTIEKLLHRGLSRLRDDLTRRLNRSKFTERELFSLLLSTQKLVTAYEDFYQQVKNTLKAGPDQIYNPVDNEYGKLCMNCVFIMQTITNIIHII